MSNATVSKNTRNSNLELLRIIAMFLIVSFHFAYYGLLNLDFVASNPNNYFINFALIVWKNRS